MTRVSRVDPVDYVEIVGQTFVNREHAPLLVIGEHSWDRWQLGRLGCPHPKAASALNRVVQELRITSLRGLVKHGREIGTYKGLGVTAYFIVIAISRAAAYDPRDVHGESVTYNTIKTRARKVARRHPAPKRRRAGPPSTGG